MARANAVKTKQRNGVNVEQLVYGFDSQFTAILDQLTESNVSHYMDLPEGERSGQRASVGHEPQAA